MFSCGVLSPSWGHLGLFGAILGDICYIWAHAYSSEAPFPAFWGFSWGHVGEYANDIDDNSVRNASSDISYRIDTDDADDDYDDDDDDDDDDDAADNDDDADDDDE